MSVLFFFITEKCEMFMASVVCSTKELKVLLLRLIT